MSSDLGIVQGRNNWRTDRATEHIMELEFPHEIIRALATGLFRRKIALESGFLESGFIDYVLNKQSQQSPAMTGMRARDHTDENIRRLMWTLGTVRNDQHFVIVSQKLNNLKSLVRCILGNSHHASC